MNNKKSKKGRRKHRTLSVSGSATGYDRQARGLEMEKPTDDYEKT